MRRMTWRAVCGRPNLAAQALTARRHHRGGHPAPADPPTPLSPCARRGAGPLAFLRSPLAPRVFPHGHRAHRLPQQVRRPPHRRHATERLWELPRAVQRAQQRAGGRTKPPHGRQAGGSLHRFEHDLPSRWIVIQARGLASSIQRRLSACSQPPPAKYAVSAANPGPAAHAGVSRSASAYDTAARRRGDSPRRSSAVAKGSAGSRH